MKKILLLLLLALPSLGATTYVERSAAGACLVGDDGSLQSGTAAAGSLSFSVFPGGSADKVLYTTVGHPNSTSWDGNYTVKINITSALQCGGANGDTEFATLSRYSSGCVLQEQPVTSSFSCAVGVQTITFTGVTWSGPVACGDIFAVDVLTDNTLGAGTAIWTFEVNASPNDTVVTPITEDSGCAGGGPPSVQTPGATLTRLHPTGVAQ